ncbi:hypothetical protein A2U01_0112569, partial [Trifolium medium]|nr:hypothetical protein [Trifolium medium]
MVGVNSNIPEHMAENNLKPEYGSHHQQDGQLVSVTEEEHQ